MHFFNHVKTVTAELKKKLLPCNTAIHEVKLCLHIYITVFIFKDVAVITNVAFTLPEGKHCLLEGEQTTTIRLVLRILPLNMHIHTFTLSNINAGGWKWQWQEAEERRCQDTEQRCTKISR